MSKQKALPNTVDPPGIIVIDLTDFDDDEVKLAQKCKRERKMLPNTVDPPGITVIDLTDFDDGNIKMKPMNTEDVFKCQLCKAVFLDNRELVIHQKPNTDDTRNTSATKAE